MNHIYIYTPSSGRSEQLSRANPSLFVYLLRLEFEAAHLKYPQFASGFDTGPWMNNKSTLCNMEEVEYAHD